MHAIGLRPSFSSIFHLGEEIKGSSSKNTHSDSSRVFGNRVKMLIIDVSFRKTAKLHGGMEYRVCDTANFSTIFSVIFSHLNYILVCTKTSIF